MKLFYGGFGDYTTFAAAENETEAIENIKKQPGMGWLPVEAQEISEIDGYNIVLVDPNAAVIEPQEVKTDAEHAEPVAEPAKPAGKPVTGGKNTAKRK